MERTLKVGYVPPLEEDEVFFSWLGRLIRWNALAPWRAALRCLLGADRQTLPLDYPLGLADLQSVLGGMSPFGGLNEWVEQTTLHPYHRPFMTPSRDTELVSLMAGAGDGRRLKVLSGRVANRFGARPQLRYCSECVRAQQVRPREAIWKRAWLLPGVTHCLEHRVILTVQSDESRSGNPFEIPRIQATATRSARAVPEQDPQLRFSRFSSDLLQTDLPPLSPERLTKLYRSQAREAGYVTVGGSVRMSKLSEGVRRHHRNFEGFVHVRRLQSASSGPLPWLRTIFSRPETAVHPICHLVLIDHLFGSVAAWREALSSPAGSQVVSQSPGGDSAGQSWGKLNFNPCAMELIQNPAMSCRAVAKVLDVDPATVVAHRRETGIAVTPRSHAQTRSAQVRILAELVQGLPLATVASNCGVSVATVCRLLRQSPATQRDRRNGTREMRQRTARKDWTEALGASVGRKTARALAPAAYTWLYRHDRVWLDAQLPPVQAVSESRSRRRVDWGARDEQLVLRLRDLVVSPLIQQSRARRSPHRLLRILNVGPMVGKNRHRLPKTVDELAVCTETVQQFLVRRLEAAVLDSRAEETFPIKAHRLMRNAGINWVYGPFVKQWLAQHSQADCGRETSDEKRGPGPDRCLPILPGGGTRASVEQMDST